MYMKNGGSSQKAFTLDWKLAKTDPEESRPHPKTKLILSGSAPSIAQEAKGNTALLARRGGSRIMESGRS